MNFLGMHFHNNTRIYERRTTNFFGEEVNELVKSDYRICDECKNIQEYSYDSQGGSWANLDDKRAEILRTKFELTPENYLVFKKE